MDISLNGKLSTEPKYWNVLRKSDYMDIADRLWTIVFPLAENPNSVQLQFSIDSELGCDRQEFERTFAYDTPFRTLVVSAACDLMGVYLAVTVSEFSPIQIFSSSNFLTKAQLKDIFAELSAFLLPLYLKRVSALTTPQKREYKKRHNKYSKGKKRPKPEDKPYNRLKTINFVISITLGTIISVCMILEYAGVKTPLKAIYDAIFKR